MRFGKHGEVHPRGVREVPSADNVHRLRSGGPAEPSGGRRPEALGLVQVEGFGTEVVLPGGGPVRAGEQLRDHDPRVHGEQLEEGLRAGDERERQVPRGVEGEDALRPGPAHQVRGHRVRQGASDEDPRGCVRVLPWPRGGRHEPEPVGGVGVHGSEPAAGRGLQPRGRSGRRPVLVQGARRPGPPDRPGRRHGSGRDPRVGRQGQTTHRRRVQLAAHRRPIQKPLPRQRAEGRVKR